MQWNCEAWVKCLFPNSLPLTTKCICLEKIILIVLGRVFKICQKAILTKNQGFAYMLIIKIILNFSYIITNIKAINAC